MRRMARRRRRVPRARVVVGAAVVLAALVAVIGGALREGSASRGFVRARNLSYGAQVQPVAVASLALAREVRSVLEQAPSETRGLLGAALDGLVTTADGLTTQATLAATPAPSETAGARVAAAMLERGRALRVLRAAVEGALGAVPPAQAATELHRFSLLVDASDRAYAAGRRALAGAPGRARLPRSTWGGVLGTWSMGRAHALVKGLTSSPSLARVARVGLVRTSLAITPAPVPSGGLASGSPGHTGRLVLPPTGRVGVTVTVANLGNVTERGVVVHETLASASASASAQGRGPQTVQRRLSVEPGASVAVTLPTVRVVPAHAYDLRVWVDAAGAERQGAVIEETRKLRVAPPAAPVVTGLLPATGVASGGEEVAIFGSGFTWVSKVAFGPHAVRYSMVANDELVATAPPGRGAVEVRVENPGGTSATSTASRFTYRAR